MHQHLLMDGPDHRNGPTQATPTSLYKGCPPSGFSGTFGANAAHPAFLGLKRAHYCMALADLTGWWLSGCLSQWSRCYLHGSTAQERHSLQGTKNFSKKTWSWPSSTLSSTDVAYPPTAGGCTPTAVGYPLNAISWSCADFADHRTPQPFFFNLKIPWFPGQQRAQHARGSPYDTTYPALAQYALSIGEAPESAELSPGMHIFLDLPIFNPPCGSLGRTSLFHDSLFHASGLKHRGQPCPVLNVGTELV